MRSRGRAAAWVARVRGHVALRYDSGRFRQGPTQAVLTQNHAESLSGCPLEPDAPTPRFIPTS